MERKEWRLFRVRPANHPAMRIEGAVELVAPFLERGLLAGLADATGSPSRLTAALTVDGRGGNAAPIGAGRARDLAVNAVLPLLHNLDGGAGSPYLALYRRFPKLQGNEVAREMTEQLLPEAWRTQVNSARRQQGAVALGRAAAGRWVIYLSPLLSGFGVPDSRGNPRGIAGDALTLTLSQRERGFSLLRLSQRNRQRRAHSGEGGAGDVAVPAEVFGHQDVARL